MPFSDAGAGIDTGLLEDLAAALGAAFELEVVLGETIPVPAGALDRRRAQFTAARLLEAMAGVAERPALLLGVTDVDLYVPRLNFVFGVADPELGAAVISLRRLRPEYYGEAPDEELTRERTIKEAIHETGHLFGLAHCENAACIMHFSNTVGDTDTKGPDFCDACRARLEGR